MKKFLDENVKNIIAKYSIPARGEILMGDPPQAIIDYVKDIPPSMIAMATRGRTGLSRMIFGSVTERMLLHLVKEPLFSWCRPSKRRFCSLAIRKSLICQDT